MLMQGYGFILQFDYGRILLYNKVIPAMTMGTTQLLQIHVLSRRGQQHTTGVSILLAYYVQDCKCNPNVNSFLILFPSVWSGGHMSMSCPISGMTLLNSQENWGNSYLRLPLFVQSISWNIPRYSDEMLVIWLFRIKKSKMVNFAYRQKEKKSAQFCVGHQSTSLSRYFQKQKQKVKVHVLS